MTSPRFLVSTETSLPKSAREPGIRVIGVMGDQSGVVSDVDGKGSVPAARMAVADFGGQVLGKPIEIPVGVGIGVIELLRGKDVLLGLVNVGGETVERPEEVADGLRRALAYVARRSGSSPVPIAGLSCAAATPPWAKMQALIAGATIVNQELASPGGP
jgi:hypothetical protein